MFANFRCERRPLPFPEWSKVWAAAVLVMLTVVLLARTLPPTLGDLVCRRNYPCKDAKPSWNESDDFFAFPVSPTMRSYSFWALFVVY